MAKQSTGKGVIPMPAIRKPKPPIAAAGHAETGSVQRWRPVIALRVRPNEAISAFGESLTRVLMLPLSWSLCLPSSFLGAAGKRR